MIFNSFTVACNDYNFGGRCRRFFLPALEGICLAFAGKFPQKEL